MWSLFHCPAQIDEGLAWLVLSVCQKSSQVENRGSILSKAFKFYVRLVMINFAKELMCWDLQWNSCVGICNGTHVLGCEYPTTP
jgi:hypothetical protein